MPESRGVLAAIVLTFLSVGLSDQGKESCRQRL
jgi:hypothetical protein